jgi:hypothetical protein
VVALYIYVVHAAAQAGLQLSRMPAEQPHNHTPTRRGEDGPGVVADGARVCGLRDDWEAVARLDGEARHRQHDAREDIDDDLLVYGADATRPRRSVAEHHIAPEHACYQRVVRPCHGSSAHHASGPKTSRQNIPSLPLTFLSIRHVLLYMTANLARFLACSLVARSTSHSFSRNLPAPAQDQRRKEANGYRGRDSRARAK